MAALPGGTVTVPVGSALGRSHSVHSRFGAQNASYSSGDITTGQMILVQEVRVWCSRSAGRQLVPLQLFSPSRQQSVPTCRSPEHRFFQPRKRSGGILPVLS